MRIKIAIILGTLGIAVWVKAQTVLGKHPADMILPGFWQQNSNLWVTVAALNASPIPLVLNNAITNASTGDYQSIGIGWFPRVDGQGDVGIGPAVDSHNQHAVAIGNAAGAWQNSSICIGDTGDAYQPNSIAIGTTAQVFGGNGIAIGDTAVASGQNSIAIGSFVYAPNDDTFIIGADSNSPYGYLPMSVGINNSMPAYALDINGTSRATAFIGSGSGLTGISPASIGATNSPANGYALRYTNGTFYWGP